MANARLIFPYDNYAFSIQQRLVDWPGLCKEVGWDHTKICGPFACSFVEDKTKPLVVDICCFLAHKG